jgi:hypothetical protein
VHATRVASYLEKVMIVKLDHCGCIIDDEFKSTVHEVDGKHYPLFTSPESYCLKCDLYRPCICDKLYGNKQ